MKPYEAAARLSATITANLRAAGLEFRPGRIEEPVFKKASV